ncbi:hypothetical protein ACEYW6_21665 [Nostoc sp. UIC 10607]
MSYLFKSKTLCVINVFCDRGSLEVGKRADAIVPPLSATICRGYRVA